MLRWVWGTALATVIIAVVISWQAKRCETAREECQATATANPLANPMVLIPVRPDGDREQEQTKNQAGGGCSNANTYLCRVLTTANLPTIYLVLIGFGGVVVAIGTIRILQKQTEATEQSAEAARLNAQALIDSERPWIFIPFVGKFPRIDPPVLVDRVPGTYQNSECCFWFKNLGKSPAKVIEFKAQLIICNRKDTPTYETKFCYRWANNIAAGPFAAERKPFWAMSGPDQYNKAT